MNIMKIPGFTAASSLYRTNGHYGTVNVLTDDSRASVFMAAVSVPTCQLDHTLTVVEDGVPTTTNYYICTTTVDVGGGRGFGTRFHGEGGGGGSGSGGTKPPPKRPPGPFGDGPKRKLLTEFECDGTSVNIETCHKCNNTPKGRICICYDCDRGSGECTTGYNCTDIYGKR